MNMLEVSDLALYLKRTIAYADTQQAFRIASAIASAMTMDTKLAILNGLTWDFSYPMKRLGVEMYHLGVRG